MIRPLISVIVCTYNNARLLHYCLEALVNQTLREELYQVIIVDNNSKDFTQQVAKEYIHNYTNFSLITEKKQGKSYALNTGLSKAQGKYIAFIDDDARASPNWCQRILDAFEGNPRPIAVGGPIYPLYEIKPPKWFSEELEIRSWGATPHFLSGNRAKYGFSGSNMAFPKIVFKKYGDFSTNFGPIGNELRMGEDSEFFHRIFKREPFFWYDPQIKVFHWTPISNMNLKYVLKRSYKSGQSLALIGKSNLTLLGYWKKWFAFILFLFQIPYTIVKPQKNRINVNIKLIQQLAFHFGSLIKYSQLI